MSSRVKKILSLAVLFIGLSAFGQSQKELRKSADKHFKSGEYVDALPIYRELINLVPSNTTYCYKYGACVVMLNKNNEEALKYLLQAEKSGKSDKEVAFFIGKAYENKGNYEFAIDYYERFLAVADKEEIKKLKVKHALKSCRKMQD